MAPSHTACVPLMAETAVSCQATNLGGEIVKSSVQMMLLHQIQDKMKIWLGVEGQITVRKMEKYCWWRRWGSRWVRFRVILWKCDTERGGQMRTEWMSGATSANNCPVVLGRSEWISLKVISRDSSKSFLLVMQGVTSTREYWVAATWPVIGSRAGD